jgi:hypothetical protein
VLVVCVVEAESRNQNDKCGFPIRRGASPLTTRLKTRFPPPVYFQQ